MSISHWIAHIANVLVAHRLQTPLFILLILLCFSEAAFFFGFILPGESALITGGVLAAHHVWSLKAFFFAAIFAAIAGDSVGYEVGKHFGTRIKKNALGRFVGEKRWRFAERLFAKYHGQAIFWGRAQALLRSLTPALAGMHRVPYFSFLKWNAAGGACFSSIVILASYHFANYLPTVEKYLKYWAIFITVSLIVTLYLLKKKFDRLYESS